MDDNRVFGPVPSRRLGKSLGINNIPPKICTYSCVYCQLGRSQHMAPIRQAYYAPEMLATEVRLKIDKARQAGESIDYLTIVPDGEPTLDLHLGRLIALLRPLGYPVAVITNSTLLDLPSVREELGQADWVSVKVDALDEAIWRQVDRPFGRLDRDAMLDGIRAFAKTYQGELVTETMLVKGVNDQAESIAQVATYLADISPATAYLSIPTRPPAEDWVQIPSEQSLNRAYQIFCGYELNAEYLIGYEGNAFAYTGDIEADLLSITAVHPMREDAVSAYLVKAAGSFDDVAKLIGEGKLVASEYHNSRFYTRRLVKR